MSTLTCAAVRELAAELALDVLDGDERAATLAHLQTCAACREEVASLTRAADELFLLVPEATPAPGFEERVLDRLDEPTGPPPAPGAALPRRTPRRRRLLAAAAALLVLTLGATLALAARDGTARDPAPQAEATARTAPMITTAGQEVGEVVLDRNPDAVTVTIPDWVALVRTYGGTVEGPYWLQVRTAGGGHDLYRLPTADQHPWRIPLDADADGGAVRAVSVVDDAGTVWCTATF